MKYLDAETAKLGLKTSFKPIVASGRNSANPHHDNTGKLSKGFCIIDFGIKYNGYCSDITRTIYFGKPTTKETEIYDTVLGANNKCINSVKCGMKCSDADKLCRKVLGKYSDKFIHGLGHGIGVEIHEGPTLNSKSKDVLKDGMVFTIEPGVYIKNIGGVRIEDDVVLLYNGEKKVLTKTTKKLLCFKI
jgi:Xaa-Pro aminopeptidase